MEELRDDMMPSDDEEDMIVALATGFAVRGE